MHDSSRSAHNSSVSTKLDKIFLIETARLQFVSLPVRWQKKTTASRFGLSVSLVSIRVSKVSEVGID